MSGRGRAGRSRRAEGRPRSLRSLHDAAARRCRPRDGPGAPLGPHAAHGSTLMDLHGIGPSGAGDQPDAAHHGRSPAAQRHRGPRRIRREEGPGKTSMESVRALKRRLSNVVHARVVEDRKRREARAREGTRGATLQSSVTDPTPDIGSSDKPLPRPATSQPEPALPAESCHKGGAMADDVIVTPRRALLLLPACVRRPTARASIRAPSTPRSP